MLAAFVLMLPLIIASEKRQSEAGVPAVDRAGGGLLIMLLFSQHSVWGVTAALLPVLYCVQRAGSQASRAYQHHRALGREGTAMGVYSSVQFLGAFFGSLVGGALMQFVGGDAVFVFDIVVLLLWLAAAFGMQPPAPVRTRLYHLPEMNDAAAVELRQRLAQLPGARSNGGRGGKHGLLKVDRHGLTRRQWSNSF